MKPTTYLLLVDDDPVLLRSMAHALGAAGYTVEVAFTAAECLRLAKRRRPDLILLDVVLPDGNGVEVCRWLKELDATSGTSVVLISGFQTSSGHQDAGLAAGADAYIVRPIETRDLVARIRALLQVQQAREALRETHASLGPGRPAAVATPEELPADHPPVTATAESLNRADHEARHVPSETGRSPEALSCCFAQHTNDLLSRISHHTSLLVDDPRLAPDLLPWVTEISAAADRATQLTQALLQLCGQQEFLPRVVNLNESIEDLRERLRGILGDKVTLELRPAPALPAISADPGLIEQAILKFAANARDAMPQGGTFVIQTLVAEVGPADIAGIPDAAPGAHVCLSFADTGCGMDTETRRRSFEAFFTTKESGRSHGLGLAVAEHIVRQHLGWIVVVSEPNRGSTFRIYLPVIPADPPDSE